MQIELAIVVECSPEGCQVQYLDREETGPAAFAAPVRDRIRIRRSQLVAVDRSTQPPQIVWRLFHGKVHAAQDNTFTVSRFDHDVEHSGADGLLLQPVRAAPSLETPVALGDVVFYEHGNAAENTPGTLYDVAVNGRPAHAERLGAELHPRIEAAYRTMGQ